MYRYFFWLSAIFLFSACQSDQPAIQNWPAPAATGTETAPPLTQWTGTPSAAASTQAPTLTITMQSPSPSPALPDRLCSPLAEHTMQELPGIISDPYAPPPMGKDDRHQGVDFFYYNHNGRAAIVGEPIQAVLPGKIAAVVADRLPYGNMVIVETTADLIPAEIKTAIHLETGESLYHLYAHMAAAPSVEIGDSIDCGYLLGEVGATGYNIPIAHLHLETRIGPAGRVFPVLAYYDTRASQIEMQTYELWRMSGDFRHFDPMLLFTTVDFLSE